MIFSAPNAPDDYVSPLTGTNYASYTFDSDFTTDHVLPTDTGTIGSEYIMTRLEQEADHSFLNDDETLRFDYATITLTLGIKHEGGHTTISDEVTSYIVTAVPEPSQFTALLATSCLVLAASRRRRNRR